MVIDKKTRASFRDATRRGQERGLRASQIKRTTKHRKLLVPLKSEQVEKSDAEKV